MLAQLNIVVYFRKEVELLYALDNFPLLGDLILWNWMVLIFELENCQCWDIVCCFLTEVPYEHNL